MRDKLKSRAASLRGSVVPPSDVFFFLTSAADSSLPACIFSFKDEGTAALRRCLSTF